MPNLYLFSGENFHSLSKKLRFWKQEFKKKHSEMNIEEFSDITQDKIPSIINAIESQPFLAEKRMIIVKGLPEPTSKKNKLELENLQKALEKTIPASSFVVFVSPKPDKRVRFYKFLKKAATCEDFPVLKGVQLHRWIQQQCQKLGKSIESTAVELLIYSCAGDNGRISGELDKLSLLDTQNITQKEIQKLVSLTPEAKIFQALDKIGTSPIRPLLRAFDQLVMSGEPLQLIFHMIVRQFRILIQVKYLLDKGVPTTIIKKRLKLAPFQVPMFVKQAKMLQISTLKQAYHDLSELDKNVKTGRVPSSGDSKVLFQISIDQFLCSLYEQKK